MRKIKTPSFELSYFKLRFLNKAFLYTGFRICIFLITTLIGLNLNAQIFSPSADAIKSVSYPVYPGKDSAYIFYSPPGTNVFGSLSATLPSAGSFNFNWTQYNSVSGFFDIPLLNETGVSQSVLSNLTGGGYQVRIWNGAGIDTSFSAWVHIDKLLVSIEKDEQGKLRKSAFTCDYLTLSGAVSIDTFYYYDPQSNARIRLKNGFKFLWTSDNPDLKIPNASKILDPNTTYLPPYKDTWYILTATDSFGMEDVDSVLYESIQVNPVFTFKIFDKLEAKDFIEAKEPVEGDAPLKVKFLNESENGYSYEWIYSDSANSDLFANEFTSDLNYQPEYTYNIPNDYYPAIVVTSDAGCIDTFKLTEAITVLPSLLDVPNVFSPDGNGLNDFFKVKFQSIKEFNISIFDRGGNKVYEANVSDMYKWDGWDGYIMNSKRQASNGAYFYVIEATGWDDLYYHKNQYRGVVYLFREKQ